MKIKKINLIGMNKKDFYSFFNSLGEKYFHVDQIMRWIYHRCCYDLDKMTDIKKSLRDKLKRISVISLPKIEKEYQSIDGTIKWIVSVENKRIETIYIPEINRSTLCISSQIGCGLKCRFCLTSRQGFSRNLHTSEIVGQILCAKKNLIEEKGIKKNPITNIVLMGMGEPLLNLKNVIPSIQIMLDRSGFNLSKRHITISTAGIAPAIEKIGNILDITLAISLHAPNDRIRDKIMPINKIYNIQEILSASLNYIKKINTSRKKITIEYIMLKNINDRIKHAYQLINCLKNVPCKINLIPWNPIPGTSYICSSQERINHFSQILRENGFLTFIRKNRGSDISAACGQLSGRTITEPK